MSTTAFVPDVVEALEFATEDTCSYIHRATGRVVTISDEDRRAAEDQETDLSDLPEWRMNAVTEALEVLASEQWLPLPSRFDLHEWRIMDDFVHTLAVQSDREELADAIRGRGAFRIFKATIRRLGLENDWYAFKAASFDQFARDWLTENGFEPAAQRQVAGRRAAGDGKTSSAGGADAPLERGGALGDEHRCGEQPASEQRDGDEHVP